MSVIIGETWKMGNHSIINLSSNLIVTHVILVSIHNHKSSPFITTNQHHSIIVVCLRRVITHKLHISYIRHWRWHMILKSKKVRKEKNRWCSCTNVKHELVYLIMIMIIHDVVYGSMPSS